MTKQYLAARTLEPSDDQNSNPYTSQDETGPGVTNDTETDCSCEANDRGYASPDQSPLLSLASSNRTGTCTPTTRRRGPIQPSAVNFGSSPDWSRQLWAGSFS
jgi:hypothetical protein